MLYRTKHGIIKNRLPPDALCELPASVFEAALARGEMTDEISIAHAIAMESKHPTST